MTGPSWPAGHRMLQDWLSQARYAASLPLNQPWPAWSTGELLAVALILEDDDMLAALDHTADEALERLRHEINEPTRAAAAAVFTQLRHHLHADTTLTRDGT